METSRAPRRLVELTNNECWDLLRSRPFGRMAWTGDQGVSVIPVNFAVAQGHILLRTAAYTALARECRDRDVAFQVDDVDVTSQTGWSVLVRGHCRAMEPMTDDPDHEVWVRDTRRARFVIEPREVTGRRMVND
jgi:nitroimidazol reductase NimA-like FMN-containing flavoprotein (pyridoxamine 5'-phosphate oxidase superfamily)